SMKLWVLDWELEDRPPADWDDGAKPYLETFLTLHTPYVTEAPKLFSLNRKAPPPLSRRGTPDWTADDFDELLHTLGCAGFGWLRPEAVHRRLRQMAAEWEEPPGAPWAEE